MITNIEEIKQAAEIIDIISEHIKLKKQGSEMVANCPFHNEKTPSFKVSKDKQIYKCFGCGKSGDAIQFLMDYQNLNYIDSIKTIASKYGIEVQQQAKEYIKPVPRLEKLSPDTIKYFETRGISNNTLLRLGVTESIEWMPKAKDEVRAINFNYYIDDELINIKFRAKDKDFKLHKDSKLVFYNLNGIKDESTCIICEGEMDCLSLYEAGIYNVVSVPNGASIGNQQLKYLDNCWQHFEDKTKIIIFTDNDEPGIKLRDELARRLGIERCLYVTYENERKDANDILIKDGKNAIERMISQAKQYPIEGIISVEDVYEQVLDFRLNGYPKGCEAGIGEFDEYLTFSGGQMTMVTGSPNSGKSEFVDFITTSLSKKHCWKWGICSFENPASIHITKLMEKHSGLAFDFRKDYSNRMDDEQFKESIVFVDDNFFFVNINKIEVTMESILNKMQELVRRKGIKGVVIDPWNYIEHKVPVNYSETQYISEVLTMVKEFAVKTNTHIFIVAHPRKLMKDHTGQYPVATMYDIAGSAHFFNKTDNGISVHRNFADNSVNIYVQKVRFSWQGKIGFASYNYNTLTRQYTQI